MFRKGFTLQSKPTSPNLDISKRFLFDFPTLTSKVFQPRAEYSCYDKDFILDLT